MQAERQAIEAAAASDDQVRRLQGTAEQPPVVEQVVGASGSQAVEPRQPGQPAATTAQPGVPRYVVPPATGDLAYGNSHWDGKPAEVHAMILKAAGPLTLFVNGLLRNSATLDEATKRQLWIDAFKVDWQGDLALLPNVELSAYNGLLLARSRSMYDRLCKRFPRYTEVHYTKDDVSHNSYDIPLHVVNWDSRRLLLIPIRYGWFDLLDFTFPIALARMSIRFGCLDLLKHLDCKYKTLQVWMTEKDPTSVYWHREVDVAAQFGYFDVVEYLFSLGVTGCTTAAMDLAAGDGQLHVVKWLHENRTEGCTTNAMNWAARDGHMHVVKWLHANRTEGCTFWAMNFVAEQGHHDMVRWLHETRGEELTTYSLEEAISKGHTDIVRYMHSKGTRASSKFVEYVVRWDNAKMLQCLLDLGYVAGLGALNRAKTAVLADILLGSLTLERAQALLAEASQGYGNMTTVCRLQATIKQLQTSSK